ncbi:MAG: DNA integrity scanning diadenylate cyclase DisA [Thermaerobacterales bacterium]
MAILGRRQRSDLLRVLRLLAPGTILRDGLDNVLRARTGGLIVLADPEQLEGMLGGGIPLDVDITPAILYELGKMDGAIVLDGNGRRARYANVQLLPDPVIPSKETGIRHRTAERVARQTGALVIAISQRRDVITVYQGELRYQLQDLVVILAKANQALQTLDKYSHVLDESLNSLAALEFEDLVTLQDVTRVLRRTEMVLQLGQLIETYIAELGSEGRLIAMQRRELVGGADREGLSVVRDYLHIESTHLAEEVYDTIHELAASDSLTPGHIAQALGYESTTNLLEMFVSPRGYRVLSRVPRLPNTVVDNIVRRFGSLQRILSADAAELDEVEGVGEIRARAVIEGLQRYQQQVFLDRRV